MSAVHLNDEDRHAIRNRLARARGQIEAIIRQLDDDKPCLEVLSQMIAASSAVNRATYVAMLSAMQSCAAMDGEGQQPTDSEELRKIFLSLA